ncbi:serine/threonine-protein kinase [Lentzea sp. NPDC055074]
MSQPENFPEIPDIQLTRVLGSGGFATVYEGVQQQFGRRVAVKVFRASARDRHTRAQFEAECKSVGKVSKLDVVTVYSHGFVPVTAQPYLVMELCQGSLRDRVVRSGPLPPAEAAEIGHLIAATLAELHGTGLVHLDVTPGNILFQDGRPLLSDFGLCADSQAGQEDEQLANWEHAAPELWKNEPSAFSDVYGLGSTLFYALTGQVAFPLHQGESDIVARHRAMSGVLPQVHDPAVPQRLVALIGEMMTPEPARRRPDAGTASLRLAEFAVEVTPAPRVAQETGVRPFTDHGGTAGTFAPGVTGVRPGSADPVEPPQRGKGVVIAASVLGVLVLGAAALLLWPEDNAAAPPAQPSSSAPAGFTITLAQPVDEGGSVRLQWTGPAGLDYAVVVAEEGEPEPKTTLVARDTSYTAEIDPQAKYCFSVQGTDGQQTVESDPIGVRGARCRN